MVSSKSAFTILPAVIVVCLALAATAAQAPRVANLTPSGEIVLKVRDNLSGVDPSSIQMIVDGREVEPSLSKIPLGYRVSYTPNGLPSAEHEVVLYARDMAKNAMRQAYRFVSARRVAAENEPQPLREVAPPQRPLLGHVADIGINPMRSLDTSERRMRPSLERSGTYGLRPASPPATVLLPLGPTPLFDVKISKQMRTADAGQIYDVIFAISGTATARAGYALFVALIDPSGEVVFYEPKPGCRGTPLEQLERTAESGLEMRLSFAPGDFLESGYTWCAAVAKDQSPNHLASNVATSPFDLSPPMCAPGASDDLASSP